MQPTVRAVQTPAANAGLIGFRRAAGCCSGAEFNMAKKTKETASPQQHKENSNF
jgi:hypothetical protein